MMQTLTDIRLEDKIRLITKPSNSPDLNISNVGAVNALQSMCFHVVLSDEVKLVVMVKHAYRDYLLNKIN